MVVFSPSVAVFRIVLIVVGQRIGGQKKPLHQPGRGCALFSARLGFSVGTVVVLVVFGLRFEQDWCFGGCALSLFGVW